MILLIFFQAFMDGMDQSIYGNTVRLYGGNVLIHAPGYREKSTRLPDVICRKCRYSLG